MAIEAEEQRDSNDIIRRENDILRGLGRNLEAANNNNAFKQERLDELNSGIKEVQKATKGGNGEVNQLERALQTREITNESQIERAEALLKGIILKEAEKKLKEMRDQDEDELLGDNLSKGWLKRIRTLDPKEGAKELGYMDKIKPEEMKHKKRLEKLKSDSPRAFKAYIQEVQKEMGRSSLGKTRYEVLKDIESTYKDVIKAPLAVQGEFFKMIDKGELEKDSFKETLDKLQKEYEKMVKEYEELIDQNVKIFGRKPAQEFKKWIHERKNFEEMRYAKHVLETEYIPERRQLQAKFEKLPKSVTQEHEQKWYEELGYSERKALMDSFEKMEHQQNNPIAQEYLKLITNSPKEVASKEWSKMTEEFVKLSYEEQQNYLKAYHLMEGKERKNLADRFEALPQKTREANKDFFNLDKEEKIVLLKALEKNANNESGTKEWEDVLETEKGMSVFGDKLRMVFGGSQSGEAVMLADIMAKKTYEAQMVLGVTSAEKRQAKTLGAKAGKEAEEKATMIHEITDGETTVDQRTAREEEFHTMDMAQLRRGAVEKSELDNIKTEILTQRSISNNKEERYNRARFVNQSGEREVNLATETQQRSNIEQMVQDKIVQALLMTIEAMTGQKISGEKEKDLAEMAERKSEQLLKQYRNMTKQRFQLEGLSTMKKAA